MNRDKLQIILRAGLSTGLLVGCGGGKDGRSSGEGDGIDTISSASASATDGESTATGGDASNGDGSSGTLGGGTDGEDGPIPETKWDLGEAPDVEIPEDTGCRKVDFLFVIDNSGSMNTHQANLVNNFDAFINGIQDTLTSVDEYQVGVVTTDAYSYNVAGCTSIGGLVSRTGGNNSSNQQCGPYANGRNFMTELDDLPQKFACAAQVGTSGSGTERPMLAMETVVRKDQGNPGQCNEDFLRDDALLVIVIITDEADGAGKSGGSPATWYQTVLDARGGDPETVVVLSFIQWIGDGVCNPTSSTYDGIEIKQFTDMFGDNGFLAGICEADYGPAFAEATGVIEEACENFNPPG